MQLFFEIHQDLPREGPGDFDSTWRAFAMLKQLPPGISRPVEPRSHRKWCGGQNSNRECGHVGTSFRSSFFRSDLGRRYGLRHGFWRGLAFMEEVLEGKCLSGGDGGHLAEA